MRYVDGYVVPVPKKKLAVYRRMAQKAGKVWRDHGALDRCAIRRVQTMHGSAVRQASEGHKRVDPHRPVDISGLSEIGDPLGQLAVAEIGCRAPAVADVSGVGSAEIGEDPQQARLAGAIWTDQPDHLASV